MKKPSSKTPKKERRKKKGEDSPLYESRVLSWESLLEIDEAEFDFPGEDFGLDFPVSVLENHKKQNKRSEKEKK